MVNVVWGVSIVCPFFPHLYNFADSMAPPIVLHADEI